MPRPYRSPVRDDRASQTRAALLDACEALLLELPVEEVTLPAVARRAGVTKPTAYSHFPDNDALMAGFLEHMRGRIGMAHETLVAIEPKDLPAAARENYRRFEASRTVLRRMMDSPSYDRVRLSRKIDRAAMALHVWRGAVSNRDLKARLGAVYLFITPASWRWLRETWGLSSKEAGRSAAWAIEAMASALLPLPIDRATRRGSRKTRQERENE